MVVDWYKDDQPTERVKNAIKESLNIDLPDGEYDTVGGFVLDLLGRIPDENEHPAVIFGKYEFKVGEVEDNRIVSVIVSKIKEEN